MRFQNKNKRAGATGRAYVADRSKYGLKDSNTGKNAV